MDLSELQALRIQELAEMAKSLNISDDISGLNKQEREHFMKVARDMRMVCTLSINH